MKYTKLYEGQTQDRIDRLVQQGYIHPGAAHTLNQSIPHTWPDHANTWIENAIGYWPMPLGIANDIPINGTLYQLPLAIEETSVIAGLCKMGKLLRQQGSLTTQHLTTEIIGQVPFAKVNLTTELEKQWHQQCLQWIDEANQKVVPGLYQRGGGVKDIQIHPCHDMVVIHILCDPCDAMGANLINQVAEFLKPKFEACLNAKAITAILSNLSQPRVHATISINNLDPEHAQRIVAASKWAYLDPHRAATHNKGIFNGIDAMCIATGNDWRAINAGGHASAVREGQYRGLSEWHLQDDQLIGTLSLPMAVGTVGGVTQKHPLAQLSLDLLGKPDAKTLAQLMVACGLLQNLAALFALTDDGIVAGHMRLHIANLIQTLNLDPQQAKQLQILAEETLDHQGYITLSTIQKLLSEMVL